MPRKKKGTGPGSGAATNHHHQHENFKTSSSTMSINIKEKPQQRNAANARERARMRVLSRAFCRLKTTLPWVPADTKLSKLDTLRLASSYIAHLKGILRDDPFAPQEPLHPSVNLTWPFGFNRAGGTGSGGGGSGSDEGEEESASSDCCWDEVLTVSNPKDCVHLDSKTRAVLSNNSSGIISRTTEEDHSLSSSFRNSSSANHINQNQQQRLQHNSELNSCFPYNSSHFL